MTLWRRIRLSKTTILTCPKCKHTESQSLEFRTLPSSRLVQFGRTVQCPVCGTEFVTGSMLATGLLQVAVGLACTAYGIWMITSHYGPSNAVVFGLFTIISLRLAWTGVQDMKSIQK
jgi:predicted nucleic-acid-binding Zn-ribbon protein